MKINRNIENDQVIVKEVFDILKDKLETDTLIRLRLIVSMKKLKTMKKKIK